MTSGNIGRIDELADELLGVMFDAQPLSATLYGLPGRHDRLADLSEQSEQEYATRFADIAHRAAATSTDRAEKISTAENLTAAVIERQATELRDRLACRAVEYTVTDGLFGTASGLLTVLPMINPTDADQARAYLRRLHEIPRYLEQVIQRHADGIAAGRLPVAPLVDNAIEHLDRYLDGAKADPAADPLIRPILAGAGADHSTDYAEQADRILADVVRPAFARYRDALRADVVGHTRPEQQPGLCWLPDGERYYEVLAAAHTTTTRTADDLHATGLELIDRLAEEYAEIGAKALGTAKLSEIFGRLREDPTLRWRTGEELLSAARKALARAEAAAPDWFGRLPGHSCEVSAVPEADAPGSPAAFYMPASLDGARRGTYYANTYRPGERARHICEATAFHEAVPGHHFQITIAQELTELPLLRRIAEFTAYVEGWGLYSERLADEMGLYSDDVARLGMLTNDSMRAGRLVVDTGLHAKGWSRAKAVRYLLENTPMAEIEVRSEVDRYIAAPGQALSYMVGRLELQRLRGRAERELGPRFDIRAFHDVVLGAGQLPLDVLDTLVADWTRSRST
ncbi:MAG: DUF885 domain-containing protein [Sciscionella sp.]|nr:DUF885 domain-containing protein [Sciscionella sp.]